MVRLGNIRSRLLNRVWHGAQPTYAQSGEDVIVRFFLNAIGIQNPTYIDIGAYHPYHLSNTAHFYEAGSHGINVEPNPLLFSAFQRQRRHDVNLNVGVLDEKGAMDFYIMSAPTMSTFSKERAEDLVARHGFEIVEERKIEVRTVSQILSQHAADGFPSFMSLDVEGSEEKILGSMDFGDWSPLVICCETISYSTTGTGKKNRAIIEFLESKGYVVYADTQINTIFVLEDAWKTDHRESGTGSPPARPEDFEISRGAQPTRDHEPKS